MIQSLLGKNRYRQLLKAARAGQTPAAGPTALLEIEILANDIARTADQIRTAIAQLRAQDHRDDNAPGGADGGRT